MYMHAMPCTSSLPLRWESSYCSGAVPEAPARAGLRRGLQLCLSGHMSGQQRGACVLLAVA